MNTLFIVTTWLYFIVAIISWSFEISFERKVSKILKRETGMTLQDYKAIIPKGKNYIDELFTWLNTYAPNLVREFNMVNKIRKHCFVLMTVFLGIILGSYFYN